jgi:hypothetical protein
LPGYWKDRVAIVRGAIVVHDPVNGFSGESARQSNLFYLSWVVGLAGLLGVNADVTAVEHDRNFVGHNIKRPKGWNPVGLG